jgi:beta-galactosidase/beta-glucuronidase
MKWRIALVSAVVWTAGLGAFAPAAAADSWSSTPMTEPSYVTTVQQPDGSFQYLVNGQPQVFIGMGYDPIYRNLSDDQRAANYERDFNILREAGVNTITGWDSDKGYDQDKFDELTLTLADDYGLGVVMPLNLPPDGNYEDPGYVADLLDQARAKVERFKDFPALRMWGVGNEVFWEMDPDMYPAFQAAYVQIADVFHQLDPNHPVIYRESEDRYVDEFSQMLRDDPRPWLLYGMNIYDKDPRPVLSDWPDNGLNRPVFVTEFGGEGSTTEERSDAYLDMWRGIREFPGFVMGGAPYVWTTEGPEPTDEIWGLMDGNSTPVDGTFATLSAAWRSEAPSSAS